MRLWTLHPKYLDARGLVALWREALLAQAVLLGNTEGYRRHPQLERFRKTKDPVAAIGAYLSAVHAEAVSRGYSFNHGKILKPGGRARIDTTRGQLDYEIRHLRSKLRRRDPAGFRDLKNVSRIRAHPLFAVKPGPVEAWERVPRPVVVVSKCLGFAACRYDGTMVDCPAVRRLKAGARLIPVCPEMEIGLGVPRRPIMLVESRGRLSLFQPATGRDLTARMRRFSGDYIKSLGPVDGFILKSRSPSCGIRDAKALSSRDPARARVLGRSNGLFARVVLESLPGTAVIDERRLSGRRALERFMAGITGSAALRKAGVKRKRH